MTNETSPSNDFDKHIVENLRRAYNDTLQEAVPQRLLDLLAQLQAQDSAATCPARARPSGPEGEARRG